MTWQLSGLGDEITEMFPAQLEVLNELGIPNVEIRRFRLAGGEQKVINEATDDDLDRLNQALAEAGVTCAGPRLASRQVPHRGTVRARF